MPRGQYPRGPKHTAQLAEARARVDSAARSARFRRMHAHHDCQMVHGNYDVARHFSALPIFDDSAGES